MSIFSVPVTIGVDEERIASEIHKNVENQVVNKITDEVKSIIFATSRYGMESNEPLRYMIEKQVQKTISDNEELIVETAAKILAEKMARTKMVREATKNILDKMDKE